VSASFQEDRREAVRLIRPDLAFVLGAMGVCALTKPHGIDEELERLLAGEQPLAEVMPDAWVEQMSIVGNPSQLEEKVEVYRASGASDLVFSPKPAARTVEVLTSISQVLALPGERGR
jgi:hypothetical protein